jgi:hypothetical protein
MGVVILPVAEVGDEVLANLAGGVLSDVGVEAPGSCRVSNGTILLGKASSSFVSRQGVLHPSVPVFFRVVHRHGS